MFFAVIVLSGMFVVAASAIVTYAISVSRERLWLRSKKAEDLYYKAEETYLDLCNYFRAHYDTSRTIVNQNNARDIAAINRHIVDLKILVGIYFPVLGPQLHGCVSALATAFDMLRLAEAADDTNLDRAFHSLDFAVGNVKDSFDRLKLGILASGGVDRTGRIWDRLLNHGRRVQSERVLSVAA
jgi:hypothetical protein